MGAIDWLTKRTRKSEEPTGKNTVTGDDECTLERKRTYSEDEIPRFDHIATEMDNSTDQLSGSSSKDTHTHICGRRARASDPGERQVTNHAILAQLPGAVKASSAPAIPPQGSKSEKKNFFVTKSLSLQRRWNSMREKKGKTTERDVLAEEEAVQPRLSFSSGRPDVVDTSGKLASKMNETTAIPSSELEADNRRREGEVRAGKMRADTKIKHQAQDTTRSKLKVQAASTPGCIQREPLPFETVDQSLRISSSLRMRRLQQAFSRENLPPEESHPLMTKEDMKQRIWHDFDLESYYESFLTVTVKPDATDFFDTASYVETVDMRAAWEEWFPERSEKSIFEKISTVKSKAVGVLRKLPERYIFRRLRKTTNPLRLSCSTSVKGLDKLLPSVSPRQALHKEERRTSSPETKIGPASNIMSAEARPLPMLRAPPEIGEAGPSDWINRPPVACNRNSNGLCSHMISPMTADEKADWHMGQNCAAVGVAAIDLVRKWKWAQVEREQKARRDAHARRQQIMVAEREAEENQRVWARAEYAVEEGRRAEEQEETATAYLEIDDFEVGSVENAELSDWVVEDDFSTGSAEETCLSEIEETEIGDHLEDEYETEGEIEVESDDEYGDMWDMEGQLTRRWGMSQYCGLGDIEEGEEEQEEGIVMMQRLDSRFPADSTKEA